jgi:hypothetical protein
LERLGLVGEANFADVRISQLRAMTLDLYGAACLFPTTVLISGSETPIDFFIY